MNSKRTLRTIAATTVLLAATASVGAVVFNEQNAAVLTELVRDPLALFGQRSPGSRQPGALFQTKPSKVTAQAMVPLLKVATPQAPASGLAPPVADAGEDFLCERLTTPVNAVAAAPASPEAERLAGLLVAAVQHALAENQTSGQAQREDAVEQAIETVLENGAAKPEVARPALDVAQARLVALGLTCAPGVPQAMKVASAAAVLAAKPGDSQPGAISQPGQVLIPVPPASGGGGGGGSVTHPSAR